jgi:hypothetical protein
VVVVVMVVVVAAAAAIAVAADEFRKVQAKEASLCLGYST